MKQLFDITLMDGTTLPLSVTVTRRMDQGMCMGFWAKVEGEAPMAIQVAFANQAAFYLARNYLRERAVCQIIWTEPGHFKLRYSSVGNALLVVHLPSGRHAIFSTATLRWEQLLKWMDARCKS